MMANAEQLEVPPPPTVLARASQVVRWTVYAHVVAVAVYLMLSLADRGLLINVGFSRQAFSYLELLALPALIAWPLCPAVIVIAWAQGFVPKRSATMAIIAEFLLSITQMYALLPAVS